MRSSSPAVISLRAVPRVAPGWDGLVLGAVVFPSADPVDPAEPLVSAIANAGIAGIFFGELYRDQRIYQFEIGRAHV